METRTETGFLNRSVLVGNVEYVYQVFVPRNWSPGVTWPTILFLHGAGERGDDGLAQTEVGLGTAIRRNPARFPCLVVFPQCRPQQSWNTAPMRTQALKALQETAGEFKTDAERTYVTGISMGGYGTWDYAANKPGLFAALIPICGGVPRPLGVASGALYEDTMRAIGQTPVWVFHGKDDTVVPVSESRRAVEVLRAVGGRVKYTEYPGTDHNSWDRTYADPEVIEWLLSQRRGTQGSQGT